MTYGFQRPPGGLTAPRPEGLPGFQRQGLEQRKKASQRVIGWSPLKLPSVALWLDAQDTTRMTFDATGLLSWTDKVTGAAFDRQGAQAAQRSLTAMAGYPALVWPDTGDCRYANTNSIDSKMIASVGQFKDGIDATDTGRSGLWGTDSNKYGPSVLDGGATWDLQPPNSTFNGGAVSAALPTPPFPLAASVFVGLYTVSTSDILLTIGNDRAFGSRSWAGPIGDVVTATVAPGEGDRNRLEGYLAWKYGLELKLPADHPYRRSPPQ